MITRRRLVAWTASAVVSLTMTAAASGDTSRERESGRLTFSAELSWQGRATDCPAGTKGSINCYSHKSAGVVPGLGSVSASYLFFVEGGTLACPETYRVLGFSVRLTVGTKGAIDLSVTGSRECLPPEGAVTLTFPSFTVTGGSGIYAGATGNGTLQEMFVPGAIGAHGKDIWTGTLIVPGHEFDLVAPTISGAGDKVVRVRRGVKRVRVTYRLRAVDAIDGPVSVVCAPRPGSRFKLGRTRVRCSATDGSGNARTATFTVTVKASR